jgi:hypothetical protein
MARFVLAAVVAVVAIGTLVLATRPVSRSPAAARKVATTMAATPGGAVAATRIGRRPVPERRAQPDQAQENPEQVDPALRREHDRLLAARPAFQHLPYRDHAIGVGFDRVLPGGALELLVTYLGSRARAVGDLHRLLARYGDPGTAYVERYQRVF